MPVNISELNAQNRLETRENQQSGRENNQELVKKVADRVYEMLLREIQIDYERGRSAYGIRYLSRGGR